MKIAVLCLPILGLLAACGRSSSALEADKLQSTETFSPEMSLIGANSFANDSGNDEASRGRVFALSLDGGSCSGGRIGPRHIISAGHCNGRGSNLSEVGIGAGTGPAFRSHSLLGTFDKNVYASNFSGASPAVNDLMALAIKPGDAFASIARLRDLNIPISQIGTYSSGPVRVTGYGCTTNLSATSRTFVKTPVGGDGVFFDDLKRSKIVPAQASGGAVITIGMPAVLTGPVGSQSYLSTVPKGRLLKDRVETCAGDSGGPVLQNGVIVGVNSGTFMVPDSGTPGFTHSAVNLHSPINIPMIQDVLNTPIIDGFAEAQLARGGKPQAHTAINISDASPLRVDVGDKLVLVGYKLAGVQIRFPGVAAPVIAGQAYRSNAENQLGIERVVVQIPQGARSGKLVAVRSGQTRELSYESSRAISLGTIISDLSAAASDSAALADLINDANNLSSTPVEPGKPLYLEGSGLGGAQFVVPGVTGRISAASVNLPTDHPLYVSGAEVWKLTIPASAVVGSTGVIRAIITIDGVEQSFDSPRAIRIDGGAFEWEIRRKGYALNPATPLQIGNFSYSCPNRGADDDSQRSVASGFVGVVVETVGGVSEERASSYDLGFNGLDASLCFYVRVNFSGYTEGKVSASMLNEHTWQTRYQARTQDYRLNQEVDYFSTEAWNIQGYIKQTPRPDGQCNRVTYRSKCTTQVNDTPAAGEHNEGTTCPWVPAPVSQVVACTPRPDGNDYKDLWTPEGSRYLMQPHYSGSPVTIEPVFQLKLN
jgi:hypothetical protein